MTLDSAKKFAESWKTIIGLFMVVFTSGVTSLAWISQNVAWASDIVAMNQEIRQTSLDQEERFLRWQKTDLENKIFQLDLKKNSPGQAWTANDAALYNRYNQQLREVGTELLRMDDKKDKLKEELRKRR
ncbi:MAG: hypothetical protein ACREJC_01970 [Tepidisphaeraceae bacterium]